MLCISMGDFHRLPSVLARPLFTEEAESVADVGSRTAYVQFIKTITLPGSLM